MRLLRLLRRYRERLGERHRGRYLDDLVQLLIDKLVAEGWCAGAGVAQYSGDAMRQLRPHIPFRDVEEGNLYERPLLAEMWLGGSALAPEAEASASASDFCLLFPTFQVLSFSLSPVAARWANQITRVRVRYVVLFLPGV